MGSRNLGLASPATAPYVAPCRFHGRAPVAQLDRAPDYESGGQRFESFRARHLSIRENKYLGLFRRIGRAERRVAYSFRQISWFSAVSLSSRRLHATQMWHERMS